MSELLCNNCGLEFKGFDLSGKLERAPSAKKEAFINRRRAPRYKTHLPAHISLVGTNPLSGKVEQSQPARGHCLSINKFGLAVSFVGARFNEEDFADTGRLLFINVMLPNGPIDALVTTVSHDRMVFEGGKARWLVGASFTKMSEGDQARLKGYLDTRAREESPLPAE